MRAGADYFNQGAGRARRGEKMILWSTYYGANYRYLMEYTFADDGTITCRLGATGRNIFNRQDDQKDTHMHIGCWRMEFDLGDPNPKGQENVAKTDSPSLVARPSVGGRSPERPIGPRSRNLATIEEAGTPSGPDGPAPNDILLVRRVLDENTE